VKRDLDILFYTYGTRRVNSPTKYESFRQDANTHFVPDFLTPISGETVSKVLSAVYAWATATIKSKNISLDI